MQYYEPLNSDSTKAFLVVKCIVMLGFNSYPYILSNSETLANDIPVYTIIYPCTSG